jgi:hypothetical protein
MDDHDYALTDTEQQVLRRLQKLEGQRFSIEQLTEGSGLVVEDAERALFSLEKHGLVKIRVTDKEGTEPGKASLESSLLAVEELLIRLSKLAATKGSTKITVYERVKERLNEELSKGIANLEFAVDRTHERLSQMTSGIEDLKERIEEAALMVEIGEISQENADRKIHGYQDEIARMEAQRKEVFNLGSKAVELDASTRESESQRLNNVLKELEVRRQVGELTEEEFAAKRDQIITEFAPVSQRHYTLVGRAREAVRMGRTLVDAQVFLEQTFNRLTRACERIGEMNPSAKSE